MDILTVKRDSKSINDGKWVKDIPDMDDLELLVRGMSSEAFISLQGEKRRAVPEESRNDDGTIDASAAIQITREVLHEVILLDWKNLTEGGKEIPYSAEKAEELLLNPDFTMFADAVAYASSSLDKSIAEQKAKVEKN